MRLNWTVPPGGRLHRFPITPLASSSLFLKSSLLSDLTLTSKGITLVPMIACMLVCVHILTHMCLCSSWPTAQKLACSLAQHIIALMRACERARVCRPCGVRSARWSSSRRRWQSSRRPWHAQERMPQRCVTKTWPRCAALSRALCACVRACACV